MARKLKFPPEILAFYAKMGKKGGKARAASLTPERRAEIATNAAKARWDKREVING